MKKKPIDRKTLLIVDDEPEAVELLKGWAKQRDDLIIVLATSDPEQAMEFVKQEDVDIAVIDLNLRTMLGTELMKEMEGHDTQMIICTGSNDAGTEVMTAGALDYLLKGSGQERFDLSIDRAIKQLNLINGNWIPPDHPDILGLRNALDGDKSIIFLKVADLIYARADEKEIWLFLADGTVLKVVEKLKNLKRKLDPKRFLQIHRSYIVNMYKVGKYEYMVNDRSYKVVLDKAYRLDWPNKENDWKLPMGGYACKNQFDRFFGLDK
ncbi:two component transcriptional regulator, LytTR family [bacterium A37T11]|nr:two component transcriptional regulator, LytTR family [bacterium A37T11]